MREIEEILWIAWYKREREEIEKKEVLIVYESTKIPFNLKISIKINLLFYLNTNN
jgi:hypothetical protein